MLGERYGPERCGALPGWWRGGTNERSLLRHLPSFLGGLESAPNLYSLTDVPWSQTVHQLLILGVDGGVELPYEQRAAVLRSQRPLAQLCRNSHFSTDCRGMSFAIRCTTCFGGPMKDLQTVLRQKELDVERVRREIQALLMVIPLIADDQPASDDVMHLLRWASSRTVAKPSDNGMADLETYYPFVRHMRVSESR